MSDGFVCSVCGAKHAGLITDWAYKLPDDVWAIPETERSDRARFTDDLCQFEGRNFIRCVLEVPFTDTPGSFAWGAWAEVDWPTFERYLELYDEDGSPEPVRFGTLANALSGYAGSIGVPVSIQFREASQRPELRLRESDKGVLAQEQRIGINSARYHEILNIVG